MAVATEEKDPTSRTNESISLMALLRPLSERSEAAKPFVPIIGGARLYLLLLYASIAIGASIEFFLSQEVMYGNFDVYNAYVFIVTGIFVFFGMILLFTATGALEERGGLVLPLSKERMGLIGFLLLGASGIALVAGGSDLGSWAALLSILLLGGFIIMVLSSKAIGSRDGFWLAGFGIGLVLLVLVPVHEVFNIGRAPEGDYPWTALNMFLVVIGSLLAILSTVSLKSRDGYLGAWLMGAMVIFLIAFHEQINVVPSGNYEPYDRTLALIGVVFSFLPLMLYMWREKDYFVIWSKLRAADARMRTNDFEGALKRSEDAIKLSAEAGLSSRFSLPSVMKADALYRMRQYGKAKSHYDVALEIDPKDSVSWCHLGNIYAFEGKRALALTAYDRAIEANPKNAWAWNNKGVVFTTLRWPEEAMTCFNKALQIDPENPDAHINIARSLAKIGRSDEAVYHYTEALKAKPDSEMAKEGLSREYYKGMCMDQIDGWQRMGLDVGPLRAFLDQDPENFEARTKEFLSGIVEQRTQLTVGSGELKVDVGEAIQKILGVTEVKGATLDRIMRETNLTTEQLVLPMALLMKTDHIHFKKSGTHDMYVSKGKVPDTPPESLEEDEEQLELVPEQEAKPIPKVAPEKKPAPKKAKKKPKRKEEPKPEEKPAREMEPTASVLIFSRRKVRKGK